ncbi:hypothetical protein ACGFSD_05810 [Streptomyces caniferus]|uniref:hypothetical protein n=1 Tax=Streptomyces caniferus TaxID=285557 RepID=UPI00371C74CF
MAPKRSEPYCSDESESRSSSQVFDALAAVAVLVGVLVGLLLVAQETVGAGGLPRAGR